MTPSKKDIQNVNNTGTTIRQHRQNDNREQNDNRMTASKKDIQNVNNTGQQEKGRVV
jgi:hypothetical protein